MPMFRSETLLLVCDSCSEDTSAQVRVPILSTGKPAPAYAKDIPLPASWELTPTGVVRCPVCAIRLRLETGLTFP
jgi:hypothetical protein